MRTRPEDDVIFNNHFTVFFIGTLFIAFAVGFDVAENQTAKKRISCGKIFRRSFPDAAKVPIPVKPLKQAVCGFCNRKITPGGFPKKAGL